MATCKCGAINEYADEAEYGKDGYVCYDCRGLSPVPHTQVAGPPFAGAVKCARSLGPAMLPDLDGVAQIDAKIVALVMSERLDMNELGKLKRDRAELLFDAETRGEIDRSIDRMSVAAEAARDAIKKAPPILQQALWARYWRTTDS